MVDGGADPVGTDRRVDLWRTGLFDASTTWSSAKWLSYLANRSVSYCSQPGGVAVEFGGEALEGELQAAANAGDTNIAFGLKAYSETTMAYWKRFTDKAYLRVQYNDRPAQPKTSDLTSMPGGACSTTPPYVHRLPEMQAKLYDSDMGSAQQLYAQFIVLWDHDGNGTLTQQWMSGFVGPKTSGSLFKLTIPSTLNVPENQSVFWGVRAWDGHIGSAWSHLVGGHGCYFKLNTSTPASPSITSTDYPESDAANPDDPWHQGVGRYGTFTVRSSASDVVKYRIGINGDPTMEMTPAATGGSVTISLAPDHAGLNYVTAQAVNNAGSASGSAVYHFRVAAGTPAKAHWTLDDPAGATTLAETSGIFPATANDGTTLGVAGLTGTAMKLNGTTGYAATSGQVVNTAGSFAVSAWARLPETKPNHSGTVVTQAAAQRSGFDLSYSVGDDRWVFSRDEADISTAGQVLAKSTTAPVAGQWTHLVGVYDSIAGTIRLYVNGVEAATMPYTKPWNATGRVQIGAGWQGSVTPYFEGDIDDVRIFDRIVGAEEVNDLFRQQPEVNARWKLNGSVGGTTSPDDSGNGHDVTLRGGAYVDDWGGWVGDPPGGLVLDGIDDHADTAGPVLLDTTESFTVAAWVTVAGVPGRDAAVFSQVGETDAGFTLRYSPLANSGNGGYRIEMPNPNTPRSSWPTADHTFFGADSDWDHVVIVYDAFQKQMGLYAEGVVPDARGGGRRGALGQAGVTVHQRVRGHRGLVGLSRHAVGRGGAAADRVAVGVGHRGPGGYRAGRCD